MSYYKKILNQNDQGRKLNDGEIKQIQDCLLILLQEIMDVCNKYDIRPFLSYGNLIGLIRHDGFIPWDDDLDLSMMREDYNKFAGVFDKELSDRYVISDPVGKHTAYNRFIQVGRKGTRLENAYSDFEDKLNPTHHIYIDIFPLDYVPNNKLIRGIKGLYANFIMLIAACVSFKGCSGKVAALFKKSIRCRIEYFIRLTLGTIFSFMTSSQWFHYLNHVVEGKRETDYVASTVGPKHYFGDINYKNVFLPLKIVKFCGVQVYSPNDADTYLRHSYGNYMEIPPIEKRESHHAVTFKVLRSNYGKKDF